MLNFPNIPEVECEFLGLILDNPPSINEVADRVPENAFQNELTRAVWREMLTLARGGTRVSIGILRERVKLDLQKFGIPDLTSFLGTCLDRAAGDVSLSDLADLMAEQALLDGLATAVRQAQERINKGQETGESVAASLRTNLDALLNSSRATDTISFADAARRFAENVNRSFQKGKPIGTDWGLRPLDNIAGMITPGDLIILGGPSGHGKSALAHQICMHIASREPVLQIQAEMSQEAIAAREILARTGVDHSVIESGGMQQAEIEAICGAALDFDGLPYELCYTGDMRLSRIRTRIESFRHRMGGKCGLVVVDTIKHVDPEDKNARSPVDKVIASAKGLAKISAETGVPILALAQVKEQYFERQTADFYLNDLYGGGDLRELADIILLIHQPFRKQANIPVRGAQDAAKLASMKEEWDGVAEAKCVKRRRGKLGNCKLKFDGPRTRFSDPDDDNQEGLGL
ncbi:DnaB-like helicase C-terminal domain-containing protein [Roseibium sp.]|uniref:DnaB-like helicase C-terminal domain-containing protein n=1 Tax=Roseibium sp. TaxID=1936156 RepID=UPI001B2D5512|nr:DnaB-like helicase C-terminal domain-containing protein [Roseibium sp.]MBO6858350.1 AAA family ATPase [Roseibium sp.]